jgi:hypothetical protein
MTNRLIETLIDGGSDAPEARGGDGAIERRRRDAETMRDLRHANVGIGQRLLERTEPRRVWIGAVIDRGCERAGFARRLR